ncbi:MAG: hypothetical protein GXO78_05370 [Calditrichaeota bacterium]|nr:hypothetical protein [Calditrichota bacterium]
MRDLFDIFFADDRAWWNYFITGLFFILAGIVIILVPEILVALIASAFIVVGLVILVVAWQIRRLHKPFRRIRIEYMD